MAAHSDSGASSGDPGRRRTLASPASVVSERFNLTTSDGVTLECRIDSPASPTRTTVLCHPHPLHGGSMNAPLMIGVSSRLVDRGHRVLRFNFRGTGDSTGTHDEGRSEQHDIDAAIDHARATGLPVTIAGWSFGAATALQWLARRGETLPYAGIAPPPASLPTRLPPGPKRIVVGTRDQVIDIDSLLSYADEQGIDLLLTPGDHFFHGRGKKIGDLVGEALETAADR